MNTWGNYARGIGPAPNAEASAEPNAVAAPHPKLPCIISLTELLARLEFCEGLSVDEAEEIAARSYGFASAQALRSAFTKSFINGRSL
jgi:hypothetical protein